MVGEAPLPSRDVLRVLGDNTRYAIYLELARSPRPLVTAEIAETLGLHPNTVRPHLDRMREVGLLDVTTADGDVDAAADDLDAPVTAVVAFANCPFADLARDHPDLVCALHHGLVAGFVAQMGDAEVTEFCPLASRTPCRVAVTTR